MTQIMKRSAPAPVLIVEMSGNESVGRKILKLAFVCLLCVGIISTAVLVGQFVLVK